MQDNEGASRKKREQVGLVGGQSRNFTAREQVWWGALEVHV